MYCFLFKESIKLNETINELIELRDLNLEIEQNGNFKENLIEKEIGMYFLNFRNKRCCYKRML